MNPDSTEVNRVGWRLSEKSRQAGTYLREVRENGMGMIGHGVIRRTVAECFGCL
jgi:hypothetical protein